MEGRESASLPSTPSHPFQRMRLESGSRCSPAPKWPRSTRLCDLPWAFRNRLMAILWLKAMPGSIGQVWHLFWLTCRRPSFSPRLDSYGSPPEAGGPVSSVFRDRTRTRLSPPQDLWVTSPSSGVLLAPVNGHVRCKNGGGNLRVGVVLQRLRWAELARPQLGHRG